MRAGKVWASGSVDDIITTEMLRQIYEMDIPIHPIGTRRIALFYE